MEDKVFMCNDARQLPNDYRTCVCECSTMRSFIAFHKDLKDFECPKCGTKFHTAGWGSWIYRVEDKTGSK